MIDDLSDSIHEFVGAYQDKWQKNQKLNWDWNCRIKILPTDRCFQAVLVIIGGKMLLEGKGEADLTLLGESEDLISLFWGAVMPSHLYKQGKIRIIGSEENLFRLDLAIIQIG